LVSNASSDARNVLVVASFFDIAPFVSQLVQFISCLLGFAAVNRRGDNKTDDPADNTPPFISAVFCDFRVFLIDPGVNDVKSLVVLFYLIAKILTVAKGNF
jgi:hypothetical protein